VSGSWNCSFTIFPRRVLSQKYTTDHRVTLPLAQIPAHWEVLSENKHGLEKHFSTQKPNAGIQQSFENASKGTSRLPKLSFLVAFQMTFKTQILSINFARTYGTNTL
jgi:hypothetical protein